MKVTRVGQSAENERVAAVSPPLSDRVEERWSSRLNYYTGRTLTEGALDLEQRHRGVHLALLGRQLSPGVARGLAVSLERNLIEAAVAPKPSPLDPALDDALERQFKASIGADATWDSTFFSWTVHLTPGQGIAATGEDATLTIPMAVELERLPVVGDPEAPARGVGVLLLQPVSAEIVPRPAAGGGAADTAFDWTVASTGTDPCELDPADDPFADWQILDGCRLAFYPLPAEWELPAAGPRFRNLLAYDIFRREIAEGGLPWEGLGVPLLLLHISRYGTVTFSDRAAVVRQGGGPYPVRPLLGAGSPYPVSSLPGAGSAYLWQARMEGFFAQVQELRRLDLSWSDIAASFRYLPPLGVLPAELLTLESGKVGFFPADYEVVAVPVPEEQMEVALEQTAGLAPFDLDQPDRVRLLAPVPQQYFEPRLFIREVVDPIFDETIAALLAAVAGSLGQRNVFRRMGPLVAGALDRGLVPRYPLRDPSSLPGERAGSYTPDAKHDFAGQTRAALAALHQLLVLRKYPLSAEELSAFDPEKLRLGSFRGLTPLIEELEQKIALSDHSIDFGFLKVQTDIYRVRQVMLGNVEGTRLATSAVLAGIAQGDTSYASGQKLSSYFDQARTGSGLAANLREGAPADAVATRALRAGPATASFADLGLAERVSMETMVSGRQKLGFAAAELVTKTEVASDNVIYQAPIVGEALEFRTTTVTERIKDPPAPEAKSYALATHADVVASIAALPIHLDDLEIPVTSPDTFLMTKQEYEKLLGAQKVPSVKQFLAGRAQSAGDRVALSLAPLTAREKEALGPTQAANMERFLAQHRGAPQRMPVKEAQLPALILSGFLHRIPNDSDESAFLAGGVSALENATALLRRVEARIKSYREVVAEAKKTVEQLNPILAAWRAALAETDHALANQRHDLTVARALRAEEQARIEGINRRRSEVVKHQVKSLFFCRERSVTTANQLPALRLDGVYADPVPACLASGVQPPDELREMVELFRDVPLTWLPFAWPLLGRLDRPELIREVYGFARDRAALRLARPLPDAAAGANATGYAAAVSSLLTLYRERNQASFRQKAGLEEGFFTGASWKQIRDRAQDDLFLADLIESGRGVGVLARLAAQELEQIGQVAACFHLRCGEVTPAVRLQWAELISVFDRPVGLRSLAALPGWDQVDHELRRDLQRLADWLFGRVNGSVPAAVNLMNDLVRVAILMASHAPVSAIVDGHLPKPVRIVVGGFIDLAIDRGRVGIGMEVALHLGDAVVARGVVEDLAEGAARVQVVHAESAQVELPQGAVAKFFPAPSGGTFNPRRG